MTPPSRRGADTFSARSTLRTRAPPSAVRFPHSCGIARGLPLAIECLRGDKGVIASSPRSIARWFCDLLQACTLLRYRVRAADASAAFFVQPRAEKEAQAPYARNLNSGYEFMTQV